MVKVGARPGGFVHCVRDSVSLQISEVSTTLTAARGRWVSCPLRSTL